MLCAKYLMLYYDGKFCFQSDYNNLDKLQDYIENDLKPVWAIVVHIPTGDIYYTYKNNKGIV